MVAVRRVVTVLGAVLLLAGCATPGAPGAVPPGAEDDDATPSAASPSEDATDQDPADLVGLWLVEGEGVQDGTTLRVQPLTFMVAADCSGLDSGAWDAAGGRIVMQHYAEPCGPDDGTDAAGWVERTARYERTEDGWALLDEEGATTALLRAADEVEPHPGFEDADYHRPPSLTPEWRAVLSRSEPLPDGLAQVTAEDLVGRWLPAGGPAGEQRDEPHLEIAADGTWSGSDGCNGHAGRWTVTVEGRVLAPIGMSTLAGCPGPDVPSWFTGASLAGLDGDELVLVDHEGAELGRLVAD